VQTEFSCKHRANELTDTLHPGADSANSSDLCQPSHDSEFVPTKSFEGVKSFFRWIWDSVINLFNDRWCRSLTSPSSLLILSGR
jgi:hypothetical protein